MVAVKRAQWPLSCVDIFNLIKKKNSFSLIVKKKLKLKYWDFFSLEISLRLNISHLKFKAYLITN